MPADPTGGPQQRPAPAGPGREELTAAVHERIPFATYLGVELIEASAHTGRTTIVVQTDLFDAHGRRAARVTQTQAVLQPRSTPAVP
jgi:acyl-coenzyme A thioesterase PaaI-like protein